MKGNKKSIMKFIHKKSPINERLRITTASLFSSKGVRSMSVLELQGSHNSIYNISKVPVNYPSVKLEFFLLFNHYFPLEINAKLKQSKYGKRFETHLPQDYLRSQKITAGPIFQTSRINFNKYVWDSVIYSLKKTSKTLKV